MIEEYAVAITKDNGVYQMCVLCRKILRVTATTPYYAISLKCLQNYIDVTEIKSNLICHECYQKIYDRENKDIISIKESVQKLVKLAKR